MPNKNTFSIKPIKELIEKHIKIIKDLNPNAIIIDPFANSNKLANITNDLDTTYDTDFHLDAIDFLKTFDDESVDMVLFDSPYSPRQVSECYKNLGMTVDHKTTQSSYWSNLKKEISRITKKNGIVITFAWNSGGIGKSYGFEIKEILLVAHGGWHNDTICTVEEKRRNQRLNITSEIEIKEKISNLANKLIEYLYMSKDFKEELKKLEIKRLQSDSLYKDYIHHEKDIDCMDLGSSILYRIKINSLGTIDVELQNSKIESIQIIYKEIANFKIFKYALFFNPKPITNINQVIIANPKEKLKEFTQFCNEVKNRYKE